MVNTKNFAHFNLQTVTLLYVTDPSGIYRSTLQQVQAPTSILESSELALQPKAFFSLLIGAGPSHHR